MCPILSVILIIEIPELRFHLYFYPHSVLRPWYAHNNTGTVRYKTPTTKRLITNFSLVFCYIFHL